MLKDIGHLFKMIQRIVYAFNKLKLYSKSFFECKKINWSIILTYLKMEGKSNVEFVN